MDRITGTAHKTHGFVKRNIQTKISGVREAAYNNLVRSQLEYVSAICDPHHRDKISQIEKVQRRAARWTTCNFDRRANVAEMLESLGWRPLEQRRADAFVASIRLLRTWSQCPSLITTSQTLDHPDAAILGFFALDYYKHSFFPLAIVQWNALPGDVVSSQSRRQLASCNIPSPKSQV